MLDGRASMRRHGGALHRRSRPREAPPPGRGLVPAPSPIAPARLWLGGALPALRSRRRIPGTAYGLDHKFAAVPWMASTRRMLTTRSLTTARLSTPTTTTLHTRQQHRASDGVVRCLRRRTW